MINQEIGLFIQNINKFISSIERMAKFKFNFKLLILIQYYKYNYSEIAIIY